jgi:hypothetical protein
MKRVSSLPVFFFLVACPLPVSTSTEEDGQQYKWGTPSEQQRENPFLEKKL